MSIVHAIGSKCKLPIPLPCYVLVMCWPFGMRGKDYETDIIMRGERAAYNSFLQHRYSGLTLTYSTTPSWEIVVRGIDIAQWCRCAEHIQDLMCTVCSAFCVSHQHSFTLQKHSYKQIRHYAYCEVPDGSVIGLDYCSPLFRGLFLHWSRFTTFTNCLCYCISWSVLHLFQQCALIVLLAVVPTCNCVLVFYSYFFNALLVSRLWNWLILTVLAFSVLTVKSCDQFRKKWYPLRRGLSM